MRRRDPICRWCAKPNVGAPDYAPTHRDCAREWLDALASAPTVRDRGCGASDCRHRRGHGSGMSGPRCRCDDCPACGARVRPEFPGRHREWCSTPEWVRGDSWGDEATDGE
jgi:hypothetical protein